MFRNTTRWRMIRILFILGILLTIIYAMCLGILAARSWIRISMETVPGPDVVKDWMGEFLVEADQIQGVYRNMDIDSLVFTYQTTAESEDAFWVALLSRLQGTGWLKSSSGATFREFYRIERSGLFWSAEVARIAFTVTNTVVVAYVQDDPFRATPISRETGVGKWAEKVIWPKFKELVKQE